MRRALPTTATLLAPGLLAPVLLALGLLGAAGPATANDPASMEELRAANGTRLAKDDVMALVSGKRNENVAARSGMTRQFTQEADGRLIGRSFGGAARAGGFTGDGTWNVADDGRFCVDLTWNTANGRFPEKWCSPVFKVGDAHYFVTGTGADAKPWKQNFK